MLNFHLSIFLYIEPDSVKLKANEGDMSYFYKQEEVTFFYTICTCTGKNISRIDSIVILYHISCTETSTKNNVKELLSIIKTFRQGE